MVLVPQEAFLPGIDDAPQQRHILRRHLAPDFGVCDKEYAVRVRNEFCGAAGCEIGQDGDYDGLIGVDRKEEYSPAGRVPGADGYLVSGLYAGRLEKDMVAFYEFRHLRVRVNCTLVVTESGLFGILVNLGFQFLEIVHQSGKVYGLQIYEYFCYLCLTRWAVSST